MRVLSKSLEAEREHDYYAGIDLGKKVDHSVVAVVRRDEDALRLVAMKIFPLGTEYTGVIGYLRLLADRLRSVHRFLSIKPVSAKVS